MRKYIYLFFSVVFGMFCSTGTLYAQHRDNGPAFSSDDAWQASLQDLKKSMNEILAKNEELLAENNLLRKKILEVHTELEKLKAEEVRAVSPKQEEILAEKSKDADALEKKADDVNKKIEQLQNENKELKERKGEPESRKAKDEGLFSLKTRINDLER